MTNPWYNHSSGQPVTLSRGASSAIRSDFDGIASAFDLLAVVISAIVGGGNPFGIGPITRTSNTILTTSNRGALIKASSSFTQTFDTPANLGYGWFVFYSNEGNGDITIPSSDGVTNWKMFPGEIRIYISDSSSIISLVLKGFSREWTVNDTFPKPPGYKLFYCEAKGPGGSSGSGRRGAAGTLRTGGAGGGGDSYVAKLILASLFGTTETITIGQPGTPGAAVTIDDTDGNNALPGTSTTLGSLLTAYAGGPGIGGSSSAVVGAGGSGVLGAGDAAGAGTGGAPMDGDAVSNNGSRGMGGAGSNASSAYPSGDGGGSGAPSGNATPNAGGCSLRGGPGGGSGGSITAANALVNGGDGGSFAGNTGGGAIGGTSSTTAPTAGTAGANGKAGGGGGAGKGVAGAAGGAGDIGAGAGGGGASVNGSNSGAGALGGVGWLRISGLI